MHKEKLYIQVREKQKALQSVFMVNNQVVWSTKLSSPNDKVTKYSIDIHNFQCDPQAVWQCVCVTRSGSLNYRYSLYNRLPLFLSTFIHKYWDKKHLPKVQTSWMWTELINHSAMAGLLSISLSYTHVCVCMHTHKY